MIAHAQIDALGLSLCRLQGNIFRESLDIASCSSAVFIRRFLRSEVASLLDAKDMSIGSDCASSLVQRVQAQYNDSAYGTKRFSPEAMYWMGYLLRYWAYTRNETSARIGKIIPARELNQLYLPYHSLDPSQAIDRICEAKDIQANCADASTTEGVRKLKALRKNNAAMQGRYEYYYVQF